ncbi:MAG: 30S ribosomal protein S20 [Planctomycetes bacterium]|nr:30S ribosomal protein S20 [Planctomycetota bacterium]
MANSNSASKRVRQNERNRVLNRARKSRVKSETRKFLEAVAGGDAQVAKEQYIRVTKVLDQTAAKGTLHKNTVARRKSRLARRLNAVLAAGAA